MGGGVISDRSLANWSITTLSWYFCSFLLVIKQKSYYFRSKMKKRRKKQPPKIYFYSSLVDNSSISSKLKTQKCSSSTSGTIFLMYENNSIPLPRYNHYPMHSNASTNIHVKNQNDGFHHVHKQHLISIDVEKKSTS